MQRIVLKLCPLRYLFLNFELVLAISLDLLQVLLLNELFSGHVCDLIKGVNTPSVKRRVKRQWQVKCQIYAMDLGPIWSVKGSVTIDLHWWHCRCLCR